MVIDNQKILEWRSCVAKYADMHVVKSTFGENTEQSLSDFSTVNSLLKTIESYNLNANVELRYSSLLQLDGITLIDGNNLLVLHDEDTTCVSNDAELLNCLSEDELLSIVSLLNLFCNKLKC